MNMCDICKKEPAFKTPKRIPIGLKSNIFITIEGQDDICEKCIMKKIRESDKSATGRKMSKVQGNNPPFKIKLFDKMVQGMSQSFRPKDERDK